MAGDGVFEMSFLLNVVHVVGDQRGGDNLLGVRVSEDALLNEAAELVFVDGLADGANLVTVVKKSFIDRVGDFLDSIHGILSEQTLKEHVLGGSGTGNECGSDCK